MKGDQLIYIDRLSIATCFLATKISRSARNDEGLVAVRVLDRVKRHAYFRVLKTIMRWLGLEVSETNFFAGHLRSDDGNNPWMTSKPLLDQLAYTAAERDLRRLKVGVWLFDNWEKQCILLHLAKMYFSAADHKQNGTALKVLVAEILSNSQGGATSIITNGSSPYLILGIQKGIDSDSVRTLSSALRIITYTILDNAVLRGRIACVLVSLVELAKNFSSNLMEWVTGKRTGYGVAPEFGDTRTPAVLLMHEDELSLDRTYRTQPHWLFSNDLKPVFRTLVLETSFARPAFNVLKSFLDYQIFWVPKKVYSRTRKNKVTQKINRTLWRLVWSGLFDWSVSGLTLHRAVTLFRNANSLASFCTKENVKVFMVSENYLPQADAMNVIRKDIDVTTLSFQYSNMSYINAPMMTVADKLLSFSPLFHGRWNHYGCRPRDFIDVGYIYGASVDLLTERSRNLRSSLENEGVDFVLAIFDETISHQSDKYGCVSVNEYLEEVRVVAKYVIDNPTVGVIRKVQFITSRDLVERSGVFQEYGDISLRWVELYRKSETNRNKILPAEAAIAADIAIGHVMGATAGLEAVLAGCRCILINPMGVRNDNLDLFLKGNIVYPDMEAALNAITAYRKGVSEQQDLGDWSEIIPYFDSYCDGESARRCRNEIEKAISTQTSR